MASIRSGALTVIVVLGTGIAGDRASAIGFDLDVGCTIGNVSGADACISPVPGGNGGNVGTAQLDAYDYPAPDTTTTGAFGLTGWKQISDIGSVGSASDNGILSITNGGDWKSGTWRIAAGFAFAPGATYALALKGGTDNAVYRLTSAIVAGVSYGWSAGDLTTPNGRNITALSNIALFGTADLVKVVPPGTVPPNPPISVVPLPAAGWLMMAGLAALASLRLRRAA
jgi:hypothetical protein